MICPNLNHPDWKNLVKEVGLNKAYILWNKDDATLSELKIVEDEPEKSEIQELADKTKLFLQKKLSILQNKNIPNKKQKENELKRIIDNIKALDEVSTINTFIEESYTNIKQAEGQFDKMLKNKDNLTRSEMIEKLSSFNDFANGYSILDEISQSDIEEYFTKPEKGINEQGSFTIQDKLAYALLARDKIKQRYLKQGIPLLADYLLEHKSERLSEKVIKEIAEMENRISVLQSSRLTPEAKEKRIKDVQDRIDTLKGFDLDKKTLIKQLQLASQDEGALDYLFSPLISSDDSALALFAKSIKSKLEDARLKDITFAEEAQKEFNKFLDSNKHNRDHVEKFNSDIYEEVQIPTGRDSDGNTTYRTEKSFVQKYDITKFEKDKNEFFAKLGKKPLEAGKALDKWNKSVAAWFGANTRPKNQHEIDRIIKDKKEEVLLGIATKDEYEKWERSVMSEYKNIITYKRELTEPELKYTNAKWEKLYAEDGVPTGISGQYHKFLLESYLKAQEKLPENYRKGYTLPSIQKTGLERVQTQGLVEAGKKSLKDSALKQSYDTEYGLSGLGEKDAKFLPVFFTQPMDAKDVSSDLIGSILRFNSMVNKYEALNNINGEISLVKTVIGQRETIETNSKGQKIMDAFAKKFGYNEYIRQNGESYSQKHLDAFIDMIVYGEMSKSEEIFGLEAGKLTNTLLGYSAMSTLALDLLKGTANNIQGNIQVIIEANSGEYFDKSNIIKGKAYYYKNVPKMLSDFGKIAPETLPSKLIELYDAIQGEFQDSYGQNISGSTARKLFQTNTLFFNQNLGEHEIQVPTLFAILDKHKVLDKETNEPISLLDAYEKYGLEEIKLENGTKVSNIEHNTDFTEAKRKEIMNNLHAIAKRLHGVYNDFDKATVARYSLGRLVLQYRKHLVPAYKRRFKHLSGDQELGGLTEGFYRTFWNTFIRDIRDLNFNIKKNWEGYSDFEKGQIKRTTAEAVFISSLTAMSMVLKGLGDDDKELKKNYMYNFILYQAIRQRSETSAYISPIDAYRVVKSPSAMTTTLDRTIKFTDQLLFTWNPKKLTYQQKSGIYDKGTNKSYAYFLKLIGISSYNLHPEEAIKSFNSTLSK